MTLDTTAAEPAVLTTPDEALAYIIEMVEELANMAARNGAKDLSSDLFVVCSDARRRYKQPTH